MAESRPQASGTGRPRSRAAGGSQATGRRASPPAPAVEPPPAPAAEERPPPLCQVALCPICATVMLLGDVQPELVEHLLAAGREVLLAMRAVIDTRLKEADPPQQTIQRLTIK